MAIERSVVRPAAAPDRRPALAAPPVRAAASAPVATASLQQRLGAPALHALAAANGARAPAAVSITTGPVALLRTDAARSAVVTGADAKRGRADGAAPLARDRIAAGATARSEREAPEDARVGISGAAKLPPGVPATAAAAASGASAPAGARIPAAGARPAPAQREAGAGPAPAAATAAGAGPAAVQAGAPSARAAASPAGPAGKERAARGEGAATPSPHAAIAPAVGAVRHRAAKARSLPPASAPVGSAQAAAIVPRTEQTREAARQTVTNLDAAKAQAVRRAEFKNKLKQAIDAATPKPKTESEADKVRKTGGAQASSTLRGQLATERDAAAGPMKSAAESEVTAASQPAPPKTDLETIPVGPPPAPVSAAPVVPAPLPPERLDYSEDRAPTDQAMAENDVTKAQLEKGNEPAFGPTLEARQTAEQHEAQSEGKYRQQEAQVQGHALGVAQGTLAKDLGGMHGARALQVGQVTGRQTATMAKNAAERQRITDTIAGIKERTRNDVDTILKTMEKEAADIFEAGLKKAEQAYEDTFEEEKGGVGTWLTTWGSDWEELIERSLGKARVEYLHQVDIAIDQVADYVEGKLAEAKQRVATGRQEVDTFVNGLDASVRQFGAEALEAVGADFEAMTSDIDQRRDALVDKLAQQYKASYERMSAKEEALREANKSLWQRVYDATVGLIKKIIAFKDMLLGILAKAAGVIRDIISDPIGFLGNLISGVMLGLKNFMSNIGTHLKKGLMEWVFGALAGAGLQLPDTFDLKGIVSIILQVLGLTYANFRARAVAIVGEPVVSALEKAAEVFKIVATEGVGGLWRFIKEKVEDLKSMVLDAIFDFIKERVIIAGVTWIIGLLNPASAFFKACKAIYDIVMFFINRGSQILALVNAVIDSIAAIVKGSIGVAANMVENALAKAIPVAIGFLAGLLGLGDISGTIKKTIEKAQAPVNKAIDWVINGAVKVVKAAGKLVSGAFARKDKEKPEDADEKDPTKAARVAAGLEAIDVEERRIAKDGRVSRKEAEAVAARIKGEHPVFRSITVVDGDDSWEYDYVASPGRRKKTADHKEIWEDKKAIYRIVHEIAAARFASAEAAAGATPRSEKSGRKVSVPPGGDPVVAGAKIAGRQRTPGPGETVELSVGEAEAKAKQGGRKENIVIAGLGKYREITAKLLAKGLEGPKLAQAIIKLAKTGETDDPDVTRCFFLLFGAEPARVALAAVTSKLAIITMSRGASLIHIFGIEDKELEFGGGEYPQSAQGAKKAAERAKEQVIEGKEFREGTKISRRAQEEVDRTVKLVQRAVDQRKINSLDELRACIEELLDQLDKEMAGE